MSCLIIFNSNIIEFTVHTSCYSGLGLTLSYEQEWLKRGCHLPILQQNLRAIHCVFTCTRRVPKNIKFSIFYANAPVTQANMQRLFVSRTQA